ncbi:MAG: hypothetical protein E4H10_06900 [Bacteroidia bacterium]|nr:MAG: hypothetical protein E4H10_06900 [Bacteroidia bacterium]
MIPGHSSFKTEIKKLKFETNAGLRFPATALIHFQVEGREKPLVELMGYLGEKEIYKAIDRGEELNLDNCYIEKFSLRDYRLTRNLEEKEVVILKGFTARNSLFGGDANLDFSNAIFEGIEFSLEGAWINRGDVIFESAHFKTEHLTFHNTHFPEGYFNFKNVHIDAAEVSFKNCCFGDGTKGSISTDLSLVRERWCSMSVRWVPANSALSV